MKYLYIAFLAGSLIAIPSLGYAQQQTEEIGKREYFSNCAICHGNMGKGDGPYNSLLRKPAADLTEIQKKNMGVFPFDRIYQVIDGRADVAAHGSRDMPIWGDRFKREAIGYFGITTTPHRVDSLLRGRILALVGYIYTLQAK